MPNLADTGIDIGFDFDFARAEAAVAALRSTADLIDRQTDARVRLAADAKQEWRGRSRDVFDLELSRIAREAADLAAALRSAARSIEATAVDARRGHFWPPKAPDRAVVVARSNRRVEGRG
ncbi:MAG: hypothetical protein QOF60_864 [Actinomycetota bacterium]|jgi:uncharacterized protein YukE|nr:hypothetical protein [Actinomycetota bacterium]